MARTARAFVLASGERYASLVINLVATAILSRLLTPAEFGLVAIGFATAALMESIREFSAANYLVQAQELTRDALRTVFTINIGLMLVSAGLLFVFAEPLAELYHLPALTDFLRVLALGLLLSPTAAPVSALLTRELAFARKGSAVVAVALLNATASILFALQGLSHMSFAWAYVLSNAFSTLLYPLLLNERSMYGFSIRSWRTVLRFGAFGGGARLINIISENAAYLIMGRHLTPGGIGLIYRAGMIASFPDRVLLGGVGAVALPLFSHAARTGIPMGSAYVRGVEIITGVHWPALVAICVLAHPIVLLLLGPQWVEAALYVRLITVAAAFTGLSYLVYPLLTASGAIHQTTALAFFNMVVTLTGITVAAPYGPVPMLASLWVSGLVNAVAAVWLAWRVAPFAPADFASRLVRSALVAFGAAIGPLALVAAQGWRFDISFAVGAGALVLSGIGWLAALKATNHPVLGEAIGLISRTRAYFVGH
jgi:O-antigen/teichoic acid export membrane protein